MTERFRWIGWRWLVLTLAWFGPGCIGAPAIRQTRLKYNDAVRTTTDEQILVNIVRLRYADSPVFLDLPNITSQFELSGTGSFLGGYGNQYPGKVGLGTGEFAMRDSPTLSFQPRTGKDFGRTLASPLPVELLRLVVSSTNPEPFFLMAVDDMNDLENAPEATALVPDHPEDNTDFRALMNLITAFRLKRGVELAIDAFEVEASDPIPTANVNGVSALEAAKAGFTYRNQGKDRSVLKKRQKTLALKVKPEARNAPEMLEFARRLRLAPGLEIYRFRSELYEDDNDHLGPPPNPLGEDTIYLKMRSILEIMTFLSKGVEIPPEHLARGVAPITRDPMTGGIHDWRPVVAGLLHVRCHKKQPRDAEVAVPYRGYWFSIAEDDIASRATLATVELLLSLQESGGEELGPVLTLPVSN